MAVVRMAHNRVREEKPLDGVVSLGSCLGGGGGGGGGGGASSLESLFGEEGGGLVMAGAFCSAWRRGRETLWWSIIKYRKLSYSSAT